MVLANEKKAVREERGQTNNNYKNNYETNSDSRYRWNSS